MNESENENQTEVNAADGRAEGSAVFCVRMRKPVAVIGCLLLAAGCLGAVLLHFWARKTVRSIDMTALPLPDVDAPFIITPQDIVDKMLELAEVTQDDVLYDLGCGDGCIVVTAAKRFGCRAVGFDNNPERIQESWHNARKNQVEDLVEFHEEDIFTLDLSEADVVTLYLLPRLNVKLIPQLEKFKPGSRIISHDFDMKGVTPDQVIRVVSEEEGGREHVLYLWTTPLKIEEAAASTK